MTRTAPPPAAPWRNRIVGSGEESPTALMPNPRNWRLHPPDQQRALAGQMNEVGWVAQVLVNRRTGRLVDGHLRVELALARNEPSVPVTYVDLSETVLGLRVASPRCAKGLLRPFSARRGACTGASWRQTSVLPDGLRLQRQAVGPQLLRKECARATCAESVTPGCTRGTPELIARNAPHDSPMVPMTAFRGAGGCALRRYGRPRPPADVRRALASGSGLGREHCAPSRRQCAFP